MVANDAHALRQLYEYNVELEKRRAEKSYAEFIKAAWHVLEPEQPLVWNWHLDLICEVVQQEIERIIAREPRKYHLLVNIPPRSLKSWLLTRAPAAWAWIKAPWLRFMTVSYAEELALEHAVDTRTLIMSDWYQERWGDKFTLASDQNVKSFYKTSEKGYRMTGSVGGKAIGRGGHIITIDDPLSPEEAEYDQARETVIRWYSRTIKSRISNPTIGMFWIIMQRLHEEDLSGYVLSKEGDKYLHICLPAEDGDQVRPLEYRKKYVNGYLFPQQFPQDFLEGMRSVDPYMYSGQYLQLPSPPEGGMFKRHKWKFWRPQGSQLPNYFWKIGKEEHTSATIDLPSSFDDTICSWDMGLREHKDADPLAGSVWARKGPDLFVLDLVHDKLDPLKAAQAAKELKYNYPKASAVLIEDAAGGSSAIVDLKRTIPGVIGIVPKGDKKTRAIPYSRLVESGNVYLPHPTLAPWVMKWIDEHAAFPKGAHDDMLDTGSQATTYMIAHRRVWPDYHAETKSFKIDFVNIAENSSIICSQYIEPDLQSSCVLALWSKRSGSLFVFDEFVTDTPRPELVVSGILALMRRDSSGAISSYEHLRSMEWWGSSVMINKGGAFGDMRDSYRKYKINLRTMQHYDEFGSTVRVSLLLSRKAVTIHTRCAQLVQQMSEWGIENKKPADGHGLARALCQLVGVLWESGAMRNQERKLGEYSPAKTRVLNRIEQAGEDQLADFVIGRKGHKRATKDGWIA